MLRRTKKLIFSVCIFVFSTVHGIAQGSTEKIQHSEKLTSTSGNSTEAIEESRELSPEEQQIILQRAATKEQQSEFDGILQKYLGVSSLEDPEYAPRKQKLKDENPVAYEEMVKELAANRFSEKRIVTRAQYNALPPSRKAVIDANPELYTIQD